MPLSGTRRVSLSCHLETSQPFVETGENGLDARASCSLKVMHWWYNIFCYQAMVITKYIFYINFLWIDHSLVVCSRGSRGSQCFGGICAHEEIGFMFIMIVHCCNSTLWRLSVAWYTIQADWKQESNPYTGTDKNSSWVNVTLFHRGYLKKPIKACLSVTFYFFFHWETLRRHIRSRWISCITCNSNSFTIIFKPWGRIYGCVDESPVWYGWIKPWSV